MPKTKQITVTVGRTVQVRQYEPVRVEVSQMVELDKDDNVEEVRTNLYKEIAPVVEKMVNREIKRYRE